MLVDPSQPFLHQMVQGPLSAFSFPAARWNERFDTNRPSTFLGRRQHGRMIRGEFARNWLNEETRLAATTATAGYRMHGKSIA